jgi:hypothetical protein
MFNIKSIGTKDYAMDVFQAFRDRSLQKIIDINKVIINTINFGTKHSPNEFELIGTAEITMEMVEKK